MTTVKRKLLLILFLMTNFNFAIDTSETLIVYYGSSKYPPYHFQASGDIHSSFNHLLRGHLLNLDKNFQLKPGYIEDFKFNHDLNLFELKLRDGLTFHNGRKATSKDLEFSILRGFFSSKQNFFKNRFGDIVGVDKVRPGKKFKSGMVEGFNVIDELNVQIKLNNYDPNFLYNLNAAYYSLIPIEEMEDDYLTWKKYPVGVGDYTFESENIQEKYLTLTHKSGRRKIIIHFGEEKPSSIDISYKPIKGFKPFRADLSSAIRILEFSNQNELSKYQEFRDALELIIDRNVYKNNPFGLVANTSLIPSHFLRVRKIKDDYSIEKAKLLISKIPKSIRDKRHEAIVYSGVNLSELHNYVLLPIKENLKNIGINIDFLPYTKKFIDKEAANKYVMRFFAKITNYTNPLILFGSYNYQGHDNFLAPLPKFKDEFDSLYRFVLKEKKQDKRIELIRKLNKFSVENRVIIPIVEEFSTYFINPERVLTMGVQPAPLELYFENIELK